MKVISTLADDRQIGPDRDSPVHERTRKPPGTEKIGSIPDQLTSAPPIVKPKAKRTRKREKHIMAVHPSKLKKVSPDCLELPEIVADGEIVETETEAEGISLETETEVSKKRTLIQAHTKFDPMPSCTHCGPDTHVTKADIRKKARNIKDTERNGKLLLIVLIVQRYYCGSCEKTFTPRLAALAGGRFSRTQRLSDKARELTFQRRTSSSIAVQIGLCRRMVQHEAQEGEKTLPTPQEVFRQAILDGKALVFQIDDAHPGSGRVCCAILLNGKRYELLPEYNRAAIEKFFRTLDGRDHVIVFVSDLAKFELQLGRELFPQATIVADPYHVVRLLQEAFDEFLKPFEKEVLDAYIRAIDQKRIVRPKRRLHEKEWQDMAQANLSETDGVEEDKKKVRRRTAAEIRILFHTKIGETDETEKIVVNFLMASRPSVAAAYYYLQSVMHLYHVQISAAEASIKLDKFELKLPQHVREGLSTFITRCREERDAICAFWSTGWTNSEIESQNDVLNKIYAAAYGLSFKELRRRWLYGESDSVILGRDKEKVLITKKGPEKKGIRKLKKMRRPEAVPVEGPGGQLTLLFEWPSQDDQASAEPEDEQVCKPPDSDSD